MVVAIDIAARHVVSIWDACIIVAAVKAGASTIWSEGLGDGADYGGVPVRNPFH